MYKRGFKMKVPERLLRQIIFQALGLDDKLGEITDIIMDNTGDGLIDIWIEGMDERFPERDDAGDLQYRTPVIKRQEELLFVGFLEDKNES
jgi:hypothetical protein